MKLRAEALTVVRGPRAILRDATLEVAGGEILGVFGPSGAGKSTLFRALAGDEPCEGRVLLGEHDVSRWPLHRRARAGLGYLPQTPSVLWDLTVDENLRVFAEVTGAAIDALQGFARDVGLADRGAVRARELSGGERRRLELTRTFARAPQVVLCDEPFAAVDPRGSAIVAAKLRAFADAGGAVILADHHVATALAVCDRAVLLVEGEAHASRPADCFLTDPAVLRHYAGERTEPL